MKTSEEIQKIDYFARYRYIRVEQTGSTNDDLKRMIEDGKLLSIISAGHQTQGRGQFARRWLSKPGHSLLFSFSGKNSRQSFPLSLLAGAAVFNALKRLGVDSGLWLKWPNDIYLGQKKLGGVLVENIFCGESSVFIVGIGINLGKIEEISAAGLDEYQISDRQLLVTILHEFANLIDLPAAVLCQNWKKAAGEFWQRKFYQRCEDTDAQGQKVEPKMILPLDLNEDGSLLAEKEGRPVKIVSAGLLLDKFAI